MKVLFDTNVVLDLLLDREPFSLEAEILFSKVEKKEIHGYLCATTMTTIHYLLSKSLPAKELSSALSSLFELFDIAMVNRQVLLAALKVDDVDFEDSVLYKSAYICGVDVIVARDQKGFKKSDIPVYPPKELIKFLATK
ncbi:MAG TPA: PIN domain-containing protein [Campylobacterales bacterium]|nr:PIN domain-containing protein [Campylobacterales bacterium]